MHETVRVRERERVGGRKRELDGPPHRQGAGTGEQLLQVLALDEFEDDELTAVVVAAVDHRDDVRMRELRDGARLAAEALDVLLVGEEMGVEHLQRHVALEQAVVRLVHARHAAPADELVELVPVADHVTDHGRSRTG